MCLGGIALLTMAQEIFFSCTVGHSLSAFKPGEWHLAQCNMFIDLYLMSYRLISFFLMLVWCCSTIVINFGYIEILISIYCLFLHHHRLNIFHHGGNIPHKEGKIVELKKRQHYLVSCSCRILTFYSNKDQPVMPDTHTHTNTHTLSLILSF